MKKLLLVTLFLGIALFISAYGFQGKTRTQLTLDQNELNQEIAALRQEVGQIKTEIQQIKLKIQLLSESKSQK